MINGVQFERLFQQSPLAKTQRGETVREREIFMCSFGFYFFSVQLIANLDLPIYMVYATIFLSGAVRAIISSFKTILYEGAGKNGSSVAVSFIN